MNSDESSFQLGARQFLAWNRTVLFYSALECGAIWLVWYLLVVWDMKGWYILAVLGIRQNF